MNKNDYRQLVEKGLLSPEEYESLVGEPLESENSNCNSRAVPVLENNTEINEKRAALQEQIGTGEYQDPDPNKIKRAESMASVKYEGKGLRCPRYRKNVEACPMGDTYSCPDYVRCEFAGAELAGRGRAVGPAMDDMGNGEVSETSTEAATETRPLSAVERAAKLSKNPALAKQAAAIAAMRRQRQT